LDFNYIRVAIVMYSVRSGEINQYQYQYQLFSSPNLTIEDEINLASYELLNILHFRKTNNLINVKTFVFLFLKKGNFV